MSAIPRLRQVHPAPPSPSAFEGHSMFERIESAARLATQVPSQTATARGVLTTLASTLLAWRERRFARRVCREMLRLHDAAAERDPDLRGPALYRQIVADRHGGSDLLADAILERASQSFAQWPTHRPLNYRDVVHYMAVLELVAVNQRPHWIHADLKRLVSRAIPLGL